VRKVRKESKIIVWDWLRERGERRRERKGEKISKKKRGGRVRGVRKESEIILRGRLRERREERKSEKIRWARIREERRWESKEREEWSLEVGCEKRREREKESEKREERVGSEKEHRERGREKKAYFRSTVRSSKNLFVEVDSKNRFDRFVRREVRCSLALRRKVSVEMYGISIHLQKRGLRLYETRDNSVKHFF